MALTPKVCADAKRFVGAKAVVEYAYGCRTDDPALLTFFPIMSLTSKSNTSTVSTTGTRTDSDTGQYTDMIVTGGEGSFQFDGIVDVTDADVLNLRLQLSSNQQSNNGLYGFIRVTDPAITEVAFVLITQFDNNYDTESEATFSLQFTKQNSVFNSLALTA
tara:strand:+ start:670 stop:1152 length:483 start_codon:yes stop_codon:yes gene_type:complete